MLWRKRNWNQCYSQIPTKKKVFCHQDPITITRTTMAGTCCYIVCLALESELQVFSPSVLSIRFIIIIIIIIIIIVVVVTIMKAILTMVVVIVMQSLSAIFKRLRVAFKRCHFLTSQNFPSLQRWLNHIRAVRASLTFIENLPHLKFHSILLPNGVHGISAVLAFFCQLFPLSRSPHRGKGSTSTQRGTWQEGLHSFSCFQSRPGEIQVPSQSPIITCRAIDTFSSFQQTNKTEPGKEKAPLNGRQFPPTEGSFKHLSDRWSLLLIILSRWSTNIMMITLMISMTNITTMIMSMEGSFQHQNGFTNFPSRSSWSCLTPEITSITSSGCVN